MDAYIALGSNIGDRELNLLRAVAELGKMPGSRVTALSSFYETSPVGPIAQEAFYNAVLRLSTTLDARSLLNKLHHIENSMFKRARTIHHGPRRMDLDLLLYGDRIIHEEHLEVPHPRMTERRFVLQPLSEIAPDLLHPTSGKTIQELLAALKSIEKINKI